MSDGDQITIEVIAAGCYKSNGKHAGWAYLDTTGSVYPGLSISASGPTVVSAGSNLTYKFSYSNFGNASATNTSASFVLPPSTTFQTSSGASCTTPSVGSNGTVTCTLNTVPSNTSGAFYVTIKDNGASGTITNGNYFIQAAGLNALYGAAFTTSILTTYPVSTSPGANGTLSCTPTTVNMGSTTSCTATANTGYYLSSISGCGINYTNSTPSVTSNIISSTAYNSDCTVSSTYAPVTAPPAVTTVAASNITTSSATLNGTIVDNGATTSVTFDYGADTNYGSNAGATTGGTVNAGAGSTPVALVLSGITCNSTYHFRVKGVNTAGTTNGLDSSFTTLACSPAISNLNDTMSYLIGSGAKVIDQGTAASITDAGLSNFNGGTLTVSIASVVNADQLGIHDQGSEANHITVSGITVKYNGNQIGTITSNGNGTSLTVSLDTVNATMTAVSALLNNITYANTSLSNAGTRSVTFSLENGVTGTSAGTSTATIHQTRPGLHQLWG